MDDVSIRTIGNAPWATSKAVIGFKDGEEELAPYIAGISQIEKAAFSDYWTESSIQDTIKYNYNFCIVISNSDGVVGYAIGNAVAGTSELLRIAVKESLRGNRFGRTLMTYYLNYVKECCEESILEVRQENIYARRLYEGCGYQKIDLRMNYYHNPDDNAVIYRKDF